MLAKQVLGILFSNSYDSALPELTALRTMGSVPVAGRYRMIDFPLSAMVNAGISKVGVITKSNYRSLMDHLGTGKPWDLARKNGGMFLLPPFNSSDSGGAYQSWMDALHGIPGFIRHSGEEYVLLCDSNVLCNPDAEALMEQHLRTKADVTVAVHHGKPPRIPGVLRVTTDAEGRITDTKPTEVQFSAADNESEQHTVNIYLMKKALLEHLLREAASRRETDFEGFLLRDNIERLAVYAYRLEGFVRVIDSLQSYYTCSMELLLPENRRSLFCPRRPVYTKVRDEAPAVYGLSAAVTNCLVADGCKIEGSVQNSILFRGAQIGKGAVVRNSVILQGSYIGDNAQVSCVILDKNVLIRPDRTLSGSENFPIYVGKGIAV